MPRARHFPPGSVVTIDEAARRLGASRFAVALAIRERRLASHVVDGVVHADGPDVERLLHEHRESLARADAAFRLR